MEKPDPRHFWASYFAFSQASSSQSQLSNLGPIDTPATVDPSLSIGPATTASSLSLMALQGKIFTIGGLEVHVHGLSTLHSSLPVTVLFLLHGRLYTQASFYPTISEFKLPTLNGKEAKRQLLICTFDQRNHGHRSVSHNANLTWNQKNPTHAQDMYSILSGTANDVSMLVDYLPSYLFPNGEHEIVDWGVMGVSLGGHAVWLCLANDDRINWGCSIVGCPSYIKLMEYRLKWSALPAEPPHLPESFLRVLERDDPGTILRKTKKIPTSLEKKNILVLSGKIDALVPWSASEEFISLLQQCSDKVEVKIYEEVGHDYTPVMMSDFIQWSLKFIA